MVGPVTTGKVLQDLRGKFSYHNPRPTGSRASQGADMTITLPWWLALVLVAIGVGLLLKAWSMNATASFNDGSFQMEMQVALGGIAFVGAGLLWLAVSFVVMAYRML